MGEENRSLLEEEIKAEIKRLGSLESGSQEHTTAVDSLTKLYKLKLEEDKLQEEGYTNYTEHSKKNTEEKKDEPMPNEPYVISPDDYGENDNYTQISLVYYAGDGVLADDEDEVVEDIEDTVGEDFAEHFGEYEDDSVFIRNDRLRCDYEILRDNRSFSDVAEGSNY